MILPPSKVVLVRTTLLLVCKAEQCDVKVSPEWHSSQGQEAWLTCTALLRKQLFCPGSLSKPLVGARDSMLPGWYALPRLPPGFRRNFTHAISRQLRVRVRDAADGRTGGSCRCPPNALQSTPITGVSKSTSSQMLRILRTLSGKDGLHTC